MQVYVNNIVKDPDSQKYRKIRISKKTKYKLAFKMSSTESAKW